MLEVGQMVRIKPFMEIRKRLNDDDIDEEANLFFNTDEMPQFCGKTFKIKERVLIPDEAIPRYYLHGVTSGGGYWIWAETWLETPEKRPRRNYDNSGTNR